MSACVAFASRRAPLVHPRTQAPGGVGRLERDAADALQALRRCGYRYSSPMESASSLNATPGGKPLFAMYFEFLWVGGVGHPGPNHGAEGEASASPLSKSRHAGIAGILELTGEGPWVTVWQRTRQHDHWGYRRRRDRRRRGDDAMGGNNGNDQLSGDAGEDSLCRTRRALKRSWGVVRNVRPV